MPARGKRRSSARLGSSRHHRIIGKDYVNEQVTSVRPEDESQTSEQSPDLQRVAGGSEVQDGLTCEICSRDGLDDLRWRRRSPIVCMCGCSGHRRQCPLRASTSRNLRELEWEDDAVMVLG